MYKKRILDLIKWSTVSVVSFIMWYLIIFKFEYTSKEIADMSFGLLIFLLFSLISTGKTYFAIINLKTKTDEWN